MQAQAANWKWEFGKALLFPLVRVALKTRVVGLENIDRSHAQVIACNHASHIDPILVGSVAGVQTWFLTKQEVFDASRFLNWLITNYNALPVRRGGSDVGALNRCSLLLQRNRTLVLFPEGTRSKEGTLQPLKPGVALLAIRNQVPVVPTYIHGVRESFVPWLVDPDIIRYNQEKHPGRLKFRVSSIWTSQVRVFFGRPLSPAMFAPNKDNYRRFTEQLEQAMKDLRQRAENPLAPAHQTGLGAAAPQ